MTAKVDPHETERKLEHVPQRLLDEFPDVPAEPVKREARAVARQLLARARFTDFVPLLVHRFVREALLDRGARSRGTLPR